MKPLSQTNPYMVRPELRKTMIDRHVYDSSVFEGARGLVKPSSLILSKVRAKASILEGKHAQGFTVELVDVEGSPARAQVVGGK